MYILQHSPPPRQCTDSLSFPIIFEPIRQFVGYKKPRGAGAPRGNKTLLTISYPILPSHLMAMPI